MMPWLSHGEERRVTVSSFDIRPDSACVQTDRIQRALDQVAATGGGTLVFTPGVYVTGSVRLPSHVEVYLEDGASILGSVDPYDYAGYADDSEEVNLQSDKCSKRLFGLFTTFGTTDIALRGEGRIDGRGLELALAVDSLHHTGIRVDTGYNTRRMRPSLRPKLFDFVEADDVVIEGLRLSSSASWGISLDKCADVVIRGIDFVNRAYWNNDGIDIADCRRVVIEDCNINSADDGIVLKSFDPDAENYDITISNCEIRSSANALKFGTESFGGFRKVRISGIKVYDTFRSAIALESVDGAHLEDIVVDGVTATNTGNGIFMRLGHRRGDRNGSIRNVTIRNVTCDIPFGRPDIDYDLRGPDINTIHNPFPNSITGIPEARIENVTLENIDITHPGRGTKGMGYVGSYRTATIPELRDAYPEFHMFGELPAWGFYIRHVDGITFRNVTVRLKEPDYRAAVVMDDVTVTEGEISSTCGQ